MLFSSLEFLFLFLPLTLLCYFFVPLKARNVVLLLFSLIFYGWGERIYIWLMVFTILIDYLSGILVEHAKRKERPRAARGWLIAAVAIILVIGILGGAVFAAARAFTAHVRGPEEFEEPSVEQMMPETEAKKESSAPAPTLIPAAPSQSQTQPYPMPDDKGFEDWYRDFMENFYG